MRREQRTPTKDERAKIIEWIADNPRIRLAEINHRLEAFGDLLLSYRSLSMLRDIARKKYAEEVAAFEQEALKEGLAQRAVRILEKMERHESLKKIVAERGAELDGESGGAGTGMIVRDFKGKSADIPVFKLDAALLKEFRDLEREIAIELGQWTEKKEMSGPDGGAIPITITDLVGKIYSDDDDDVETEKPTI
jgi:hypothetical protein